MKQGVHGNGGAAYIDRQFMVKRGRKGKDPSRCKLRKPRSILEANLYNHVSFVRFSAGIEFRPDSPRQARKMVISEKDDRLRYDRISAL